MATKDTDRFAATVREAVRIWGLREARDGNCPEYQQFCATYLTTRGEEILGAATRETIDADARRAVAAGY